MKVLYYIVFSLLITVAAVTLFGWLETPRYGSDDAKTLWLAWALSAALAAVLLKVFQKKIFGLKKSKAVFGILAFLFGMLTIVDGVYAYQNFNADFGQNKTVDDFPVEYRNEAPHNIALSKKRAFEAKLSNGILFLVVAGATVTCIMLSGIAKSTASRENETTVVLD